MTVLVTGGAGYIGSHMAWALLDAGESVCVLDDLSTGFREAVPSGASFELGNVGDVDLVRRVIRRHSVDAIIHFAGSIVVPDSVRDPIQYYRNNTAAALGLIQAAAGELVDKFIFSSTAAVYGEPGHGLVTEEDPLAPLSPYGTSKLMTELMLRDAAAALPMRNTILRYFNVAGADPRGRAGQRSKRATHLVKVACEAALGLRPKVEIFGTDFPTFDGTGIRDYIHVTDLVEAHRLALERLRAGGDSVTLNCGYGHGHSVRQVLAAVDRVAGTPLTISEVPRRPGDAASIVADSTRLRQLLGWVPRHDDLDGIVADALRWERRIHPSGAPRTRKAKARKRAPAAIVQPVPRPEASPLAG